MTVDPRATARLAFVQDALGVTTLAIEPASADASFRSYWRVRMGARSLILMDAPPAHEDVRPWLDIQQRLTAAGVHVPAVYAHDVERGFVLMQDLGNRLLLSALDVESADAHYGAALAALLRMQTGTHVTGLPAYDETRLVAEMELMPTWFLQRHLGTDIACEQWDVIESAFRVLLDNAAAQPQVFVHRDFHSRNLLIDTGRDPGIIDFQDALCGPLTYDLVSLLRDCYIAWPQARVQAWVESYRQSARAAGLTGADAETFQRWFDLIGVQRHLKVLGIFCRLWYRDGKRAYLDDLPRVWRYTSEVGRRYPRIAPLIDLLERAIAGRSLSAPRAQPA